MACVERGRMLSAYNRAIEEWTRAVSAMTNRVTAENVELLDLLSAVDTARVTALQAKAAYTKHIDEHGCTGKTAEAD